jgi:hypothetical protein
MSYLITGVCGCSIGVIGVMSVGALSAMGRRNGKGS